MLTGFRSSNVALMMRAEGEQTFQRVPLVESSEAGSFEGMLFDLKKPLSYYVEADGVASPTYKMALVELPAVDTLELEYVFPAYTGLPPQTVESGGDVAALRGTQVRVKVKSTMTTPGGALALDPGAPAPLAVARTASSPELHDCRRRLLPRRADRPEGRARHRVAEVHD